MSCSVYYSASVLSVVSFGCADEVGEPSGEADEHCRAVRSRSHQPIPCNYIRSQHFRYRVSVVLQDLLWTSNSKNIKEG